MIGTRGWQLIPSAFVAEHLGCLARVAVALQQVPEDKGRLRLHIMSLRVAPQFAALRRSW